MSCRLCNIKVQKLLAVMQRHTRSHLDLDPVADDIKGRTRSIFLTMPSTSPLGMVGLIAGELNQPVGVQQLAHHEAHAHVLAH